MKTDNDANEMMGVTFGAIFFLIAGAILVVAGTDINMWLLVLVGCIFNIISMSGVHVAIDTYANLKYKENKKKELLKKKIYLVIGILLVILGVVISRIMKTSSASIIRYASFYEFCRLHS